MRPATYRKYTNEDIQFIRANLHENPHKVAKILDASYRTIGQYMYEMRNGTFNRHKRQKQNYYALYNRKTDELVCSGDAQKCAEELGIATNSFYVLVHKILHNKNKKWDIYVEDYVIDDEQ